MGFGDIISDSVSYPFSDIVKFLIVGIISLLASFSSLMDTFAPTNFGLQFIGIIIGFVFALILSGYSLDITKRTIENSNTIPNFDFLVNFADGIKVLIVGLVYLIVPIIITIILLIITGAIGAGLDHVFASLGIGILISIILFIVFGIFEVVAQARLAQSGNIGDALDIGAVFEDVQRIGLLKIVLFLIVACVIAFIVALVEIALSFIPFIGIIIASIISGAFLVLFLNRAVGLLYIEA